LTLHILGPPQESLSRPLSGEEVREAERDVASDSQPSWEEAKRAVEAKEEVVRKVERDEFDCCCAWEGEWDESKEEEPKRPTMEGCWTAAEDCCCCCWSRRAAACAWGGGVGNPRGREEAPLIFLGEGGREEPVGEGGELA
jgi:hypothetical protein